MATTISIVVPNDFDEKSTEYRQGYHRGWSDDIIPWYQLQRYSKDFQLGYQDGKGLINKLVDNASQERI